MKNKMIKLIPLVLICILSACTAMGPMRTQEKHLEIIKKALSEIEINDGISHEEAKIISDNYFFRFKKMSGGWSNPFDSGNVWEIKQLGCIAANILEDSPSLLIDKKTGQSRWADGPTVENPLDIWVIKY